MKVYGYPVRGKQKAYDICAAFLKPCGGEIITDGVLRDGAACFYGVDSSNAALWEQVKRERRDYFYIDNSYFDATRGVYFRVTRNRLQHAGEGPSTGARFRALGIAIRPWRLIHGEHIVLCPQSDSFMRLVIGMQFDWL